ncbi:MAG: hypothetical protein QN117_13115 [Armatimonadota bacterium]|nr:hypothetical protein [Armatimonadota bacterium]MDR7553915.1 hypothetical protein [Armatimonadota bacterium]MDR7574113.1 hypothetical protein [Armatimonadota bacterium]
MARALVTRPTPLLLDEPTAALAPGVAREIMDRILRIRQRGTAVLVVEQNARLALRVADRAYVLDMGRNVVDGPDLNSSMILACGSWYLGGGTEWAAMPEGPRTPERRTGHA